MDIVFFWDESTNTWVTFFPSHPHGRGINTLTTLQTGQTYLILAADPVIWTVVEAADSDADTGDAAQVSADSGGLSG